MRKRVVIDSTKSSNDQKEGEDDFTVVHLRKSKAIKEDASFRLIRISENYNRKLKSIEVRE
jgi:hypothetical protein